MGMNHIWLPGLNYPSDRFRCYFLNQNMRNSTFFQCIPDGAVHAAIYCFNFRLCFHHLNNLTSHIFSAGKLAGAQQMQYSHKICPSCICSKIMRLIFSWSKCSCAKRRLFSPIRTASSGFSTR